VIFVRTNFGEDLAKILTSMSKDGKVPVCVNKVEEEDRLELHFMDMTSYIEALIEALLPQAVNKYLEHRFIDERNVA
jgi:hypothetical protein